MPFACTLVLSNLITFAVANLPAEIAHLLEEIQAKDKQLQECRNIIADRDNSLQKFIRLNGSHTTNPKEEAYGKTIMTNFDQAQTLQEEKVGLSDKTGMIVWFRRLAWMV